LNQKDVGKPMDVEMAALILNLEDQRLYTPAQVVSSGIDRHERTTVYERMRRNLGQWARYHQLPDTFDNRDARGQMNGRYPAWFGKTWKEELAERDRENAVSWLRKRTRTCESPERHRRKQKDLVMPEEANSRKRSGPLTGKAIRFAAFMVTMSLLLLMKSPGQTSDIANPAAKNLRPTEIMALIDFDHKDEPKRFQRRVHPEKFDTAWKTVSENRRLVVAVAQGGCCVLPLNVQPIHLMPALE